MTSQPIPLRLEQPPECRTCGAGAPVDEHFCPQCSRILALGRHGDYFAFLGLPRNLVLDAQLLESRFRDLSRKFHPDYYYNATPTERLASLERSSYLNDAYRALRNLASRAEHLLAIEGLPLTKSGEGTAAVPASLLEDVFSLNEELDEIRELRERGTPASQLQARLAAAAAPIEARRQQHEQRMLALAERWDRRSGDDGERREVLAALREQLLERNYINNLLATIEREAAHG